MPGVDGKSSSNSRGPAGALGEKLRELEGHIGRLSHDEACLYVAGAKAALEAVQHGQSVEAAHVVAESILRTRAPEAYAHVMKSRAERN